MKKKKKKKNLQSRMGKKQQKSYAQTKAGPGTYATKHRWLNRTYQARRATRANDKKNNQNQKSKIKNQIHYPKQPEKLEECQYI